MKQRVFIVVLNWNNYRDTSACLLSLGALDYPNSHTIVIDNGSTDDSASQLRNEFPGIEIVETKKNLGFAGGCNVGIRMASAENADFVWLLNNDTKVDAGALSALVAKAETDARMGAVGSAIYFMDQPQRMQVWGGGRVKFWTGRSGHFLRPVLDSRIEFITGASMLIPRSAIEEVGLLDERYFMYWEDADYCFRLREAGWRLGIAEQSKVWHRGSTFVGRGSVNSYRYFNSSAARFFKRHAAMPLFSFWVGCALRLAKRIIVGDWEKTRASWAGMTERDVSQRSRKSEVPVGR